MKKNVYSIRDSVAGNFAQPFLMDSDPLAIRAFRNVCMDTKSEIAMNPGDFSLHRLAVFDTESGIFSASSEHLCFGSSVKE